MLPVKRAHESVRRVRKHRLAHEHLAVGHALDVRMVALPRAVKLLEDQVRRPLIFTECKAAMHLDPEFGVHRHPVHPRSLILAVSSSR